MAEGSLLYLVPTSERGGSRVGWHFLADYRSCPMRWYNRYLRPHPSGGVGCISRLTGPALLLGSWLHTGLAALYLSGWRDGEDTGEWDLDQAIAKARAQATADRDQFDGQEPWEDSWTQTATLLQTYASWYGPDGSQPDWPNLKLAGDQEGRPLVERDFELALGYRDYVFTTRIDAMVWAFGNLYSLEHKSSGTRWVSRLRRRFRLDGQATGQILVLQAVAPSAPIGGCYLNVLVKDRGRTSKLEPFTRDTVRRTPEDLEKFRVDTIRCLQRLDHDLEDYQHRVQQGMAPNDAANLVFDGHPDGNNCYGNFACDYFDVCCNRGSEDLLFRGQFRPRAATNPEPKETP